MFCVYSIANNAFGETRQFSYDSLSRLASITYLNGTQINYTYDAAGNRLTQVVSRGKPSSKPVIHAPNDQSLYVSGEIEFQLGSSDPSARYATKGLPPGLKIDPKTGLITGTPTKAGTYEVTVTASNSAGKSEPVTFTIEVSPLSEGVEGNFVGYVERNGRINANLGAWLQMTVSGKGQASGKVTIGGFSWPFRAQVDAQPDEPPRITASIPRRALDTLNLDVELDTANETFSGTLSAEEEETAVQGWRNVWQAGDNPFPGYYTGLFELADEAAVGDSAIPQGNGFASFKLDKKGAVKWTGKLADGSKFTYSSAAGPSGQLLLYAPLHGKLGGSILGTAQISDEEGRPVEGEFDWMKQLENTPKARAYPEGFGTDEPVGLIFSGGLYLPPEAIVLGLPAGEENASLTFLSGGIENSEIVPDITFQIAEKNKPILPKAGDDNPGAVKLTLNPATGAFNGSFQLTDPPPGGEGKPLLRKVSFEGLLVPRLQQGAGYFLLPQDNTKTSPIWSGQVILEPAP